VPRADPTVHGILSLRGRIITVLDGRLRLGLAAPAPDAASRIIVVRDGGESVGILVDEVIEVVRLTDEEVSPPPATLGPAVARGIAGVIDTRQGSILILLDPGRYLRLEAEA
jgi:purine-binding chemotaxis protein CheW